MEKRLIIAFLLASFFMPSHAQGDDFAVWTEANVEKKINSRWSVEGGAELRTRDNSKEIDRWSVGAEASYKFTDWLKFSAGYMLIDDHRYKLNDKGTKYADFWGLRHRVNVSLTASQSFGDLSVSLRERWQYTYRPEMTVARYWLDTNERKDRYEDEYADDHTYSGKGKSVWRNRLMLKYKLTRTFRPYANVESSVASGIEKMRYGVGTEIRLNKHHSLDAKYIYQRYYDDDADEANCHILGVGYTYKF